MCILFLLFFEVLIIDRNWLIQINFILWGFFTISINDLLLVFSNVFASHDNVADAPGHQKGCSGQVVVVAHFSCSPQE